MKTKITNEEALSFHSLGKPGKLEINPTKPLSTQRDLSLAYSPGVAVPCLEIADDSTLAYKYTAKGNLVAVISNGTAVLGLGNLGALASKPVMEGKAVLFKKFADIDSIDLEIDTENVDEFVNCVRYLAPSFGGINLEDIKAPECFLIEDQLKKLMNIPIFHDDQHGTAICTVAALINAVELTGRSLNNIKVIINGAGAAAIACANLIHSIGVPRHRITLIDRTGVIYKGRGSLNPWKEAYAFDTKARTLGEAAKGADVLIGLSAKGAFTKEIIQNMAPRPIIFAMANPDPEITPEEVQSVVPDAIIATGRSDYPNQVNNALCFPYLFRGALDVRATKINEEMKIAAAKALAQLAHEKVPQEISKAYGGRTFSFGPEYIIPVPLDPRLITSLSPAVAQAAISSGVATFPFETLEAYRNTLKSRLQQRG